MFNSHEYSYLVLRLSLAVVFFWFGVGKLLNSQHWLATWVPTQFLTFFNHLGLAGIQLVYIIGIFEVLVGLTMALNIFSKLFSVLAIIFLAVILITSGFSEITVANFGLIGGFLAVALWPSARNRF